MLSSTTVTMGSTNTTWTKEEVSQISCKFSKRKQTVNNGTASVFGVVRGSACIEKIVL